MEHEPIYVTRPYLPAREEFDAYVDRIWESDWLTNNGPLHEEFRSAFAAALCLPNFTPTVNGHHALEVGLRSLGITGEVITTPFTFASTAHAISLVGATPVFIDVKSEDLTMDPSLIEAAITDKTTAIMPVHVYGHLCDVDAIEDIAGRHGLKVFYDAAHALGAERGGRSALSFGDLSAVSFHATKLFNTIEGGGLVSADEALLPVIARNKNFGITDEEHIESIAGNAKMNEFQAAMGLAILPHLSDIIAERKAISERYRERLSQVPGITLFHPEEVEGYSYNYAYMPVLIDEGEYGLSRDGLYGKLKTQNIFARRYFWPLLSNLDCYAQEGGRANVPIAEMASSQILCLPVYNGLPLDDVDRICNVIAG